MSPPVLALVHALSQPYCQAAVLSETTVLSDPHCVKDSSPIFIEVQYPSRKGLQRARVAGVQLENGFARIELRGRLEIDGPIPKLADQNEVEEFLQKGKELFAFSVIADSRMQSPVVQSESIRVIKRDDKSFLVHDTESDNCDANVGRPAFAKAGDNAWRLVGLQERSGACGSGTWFHVSGPN